MGLFGKKEDKSVYGQLKSQTPAESTRYRDVYETQQIKRSKLGTAGTMTSRRVITIAAAVIVAMLIWIAMSGVQWVMAFAKAENRPAGYVHDRQVAFDTAYQAQLQTARDAYLVTIGSDGILGTEDDVLPEGEETAENNEGEVTEEIGTEPVDDTVDPPAYETDVDGDGQLEGVYAGHDSQQGTADDYYMADVNDDGEIENVCMGEDLLFGTADDYHAYTFSGVTRNVLVGEDCLFGTEDDSVVMRGTDSLPSVSWYVGLGGFTMLKLLLSLGAGLLLYAVMIVYMKKNWEAQNVMYDTSDINQWENDQHIQVPEEIMENYDWFPDVGAHSPVQVSSLISHIALTNKGLNSVQTPRRADKDIRDEDGEIVYYKGEALIDDSGKAIMLKKPMIDEKFMDELWDASELPKDKTIRRKFDPSKVLYNPDNKNRNKLKDARTVADMINKYWTLPEYEPQRPGGAYIVDTEPVNTMVLAITRAGKGQTIIEPTLDMWTREMTQNNMVINDPKGELLVKFYVRGTVRGFQIVQFNLINAMKTDIYNPLGIAAEAAREGDFTKCALYVENIADVFFPLDGGDDPVWPNAANNAFKRAAYGLIDYYLEEEKALRREAEKTGMSQQVLETKIDQMWGKVTLYNCYQLFVQLSAKKLKNPTTLKEKKYEELWNRLKKLHATLGFSLQEDGSVVPSDEPPEPMLPEQERAVMAEIEKLNEWFSDEGQEAEQKKVDHMSNVLWEDKPEADLLTLFFNATAALPMNQMRTLVDNANKSLRSMGGAEKMLASVYGIAITAMSFFTDPTISTLTSGTLSQNIDLGGLSFPRRFGVRFNSEFITKYSLLGMQCKWESFEDKGFTKSLGKDFMHEDILNREGWAMYYFKGIYPTEVAYVRLQIVDPSSGMLMRSFYFRFKKDYQKSLDGRYYMTDPVTSQKIVKNGILTEMVPAGETSDMNGNKTVKYKVGKTTFPQKKVLDPLNNPKLEPVETPTIMRHMVRYAEKQKMVFLVTPPHLMKYAKLILILISQLVNFNFDKSYMTKSNQKPLYKTRFMLDKRLINKASYAII